MNALRASRGLAPYSVDAEMMAYAQQHSDYQASTGNTTHTHSDGTTPWAYRLDENVAVGSEGFISVDFIMNQVWAERKARPD